MHVIKHVLTIFTLLALDEVVNDGVEEDSSNSDTATDQLDGGKRLSQDKGNTNNDDDTLGSVGDGLSDSSSLLQCHGGNLVVSVKPEARRDQVLPDGRGGLGNLHEFTESGSFLDEEDGDTEEESEDASDGKLVSDGSNAILDSLGLHELLVLVTTDGSENVGDTGRDKSRNSEVEFLDGSKDNSSNDDGEAHPLGLGNLLSVDELGKDSGKGRL